MLLLLLLGILYISTGRGKVQKVRWKSISQSVVIIEDRYGEPKDVSIIT